MAMTRTISHPPTPLPPTELASTLRAHLTSRKQSLSEALDVLSVDAERIAAAATMLSTALSTGHTVLVAGNGGSAADAQHFAAELVGRFKRERDAWPVLALSADTAILTAVGNDYGFCDVFARQVRAFARPGDVLVAFSTSGQSENIIAAATAARARGAKVLAVTGTRSSDLATAADLAIRVSAAETDVIQELHTVVFHLLCDVVETELAGTTCAREAVS